MEGFEKEDKSVGCLETLRDRVYELKAISRDPYFTEYLVNLQERVIKEKHTVDLLYDELERKYRFYLERQEKAQQESIQPAQESVEEIKEPASPPPVIEMPAADSPNVAMASVAAGRQKKNGEFTIGIVAFSIVGIVFLLTAFAMLGAQFMNTFAKGMSLYAIALIICVFSELLIRRKSEKLSQVLTVLGIAGIHVSTYINTFELFNMHQIVAAILVVLTTVLAIGMDKLRRKETWRFDGISVGAYYVFVVAGYWLFATQELNVWKSVITVVILTILTKLLSRNKLIRPLDAVLTTIVAIFAWTESGEVYGYVLMAVLLLTVVFIRFWHIYYQCLITVTTVIFVILSVESEIVLTLIVAILWLFMLLFNHIKVLQGKDIAIYNYIVVIMQLFCYLFVLFADYQDYKILYFILTFLGGGFIYFMVQERYCLPENARSLTLAIFASYMALVAEFTYPITTSILLMIIGLACIAGGFVLYDKKTRIYGLVLALFVCFKITLSDFAGGDQFQRMILFFVAGVVALLISGIYIILEKKYIKE